MTTFTPSPGQRITLRKKLTTATAAQLYPTSGTIPARIQYFIDALNFCNIDGTATTIDVYINDGSSDFYIFKDQPIAANGALTLYELSADLREGDMLLVKAGRANAVDVVGVLIEQKPTDQVSTGGSVGALR